MSSMEPMENMNDIGQSHAASFEEEDTNAEEQQHEPDQDNQTTHENLLSMMNQEEGTLVYFLC